VNQMLKTGVQESTWMSTQDMSSQLLMPHRDGWNGIANDLVIVVQNGQSEFPTIYIHKGQMSICDWPIGPLWQAGGIAQQVHEWPASSLQSMRTYTIPQHSLLIVFRSGGENFRKIKISAENRP